MWLILSCVLFLGALAGANAQFITGTTDNKITILGYTGPGGAVTIPSSINGLQVTGIGNFAFGNAYGLSSITIPSSVTTMGVGAFSNCYGLKNVTFGSGLTAIGSQAFQFCTGLGSMTLPGSVTSIGSEAFMDCYGLVSINIPNGVTTIGESAFLDCYKLNNLVLPASVNSIGASAFAYCASLTSLSIPGSITAIEASTFSNCSSLLSVSLPASITSIGVGAFEECVSLQTITIPDSVSVIWNNAFFDCTALNNVIVGSGVTVILDEAFWGCSALNQMLFLGDAPSLNLAALASIFNTGGIAVYYLPGASGWGPAFNGESTALWPGPMVTSISPNQGPAGGGTSVTLQGYNFTGATSVLFGATAATSFTVNSDSSITATAPAGTAGQLVDVTVTIPGATSFVSTSLASAADQFTFNFSPVAVTGLIPTHGPAAGGNSVVISGTQFTGATAVNFGPTPALSFAVNSDGQITAVAPAGYEGQVADVSVVTATGTSTNTSSDDYTYDVVSFNYANNGNQITILQYTGNGGNLRIPDQIDGLPVTAIAPNAFMYCTGPVSVTLPATLASIGDSAFAYCAGLTSISIPSTVKSIGSGAFQYCTGLVSVNLPASVTSIGTGAFQYCTGLQSLTLPSSVTNLGDSAFQYCTGLPTVTIPGSAVTVNDSAFANCTGLSSVTLGVGITTIGSGAFYGCTALTGIDFPSTLRTIGGGLGDGRGLGAFQYCDGLTSLNIPSNVLSIGAFAFSSCNGLTSVTLNYGLQSIDQDAFASCDRLSRLTLPGSLTSVGKLAFEKCKNLTSISMGQGITGLWTFAFANCPALKSVSIPNSVTDIGISAFANCPQLDNLVIPNGVTNIEDSAFANCAGLNNVTIGSGVTSIGPKAFSGAFVTGTTPASLSIPDNVTSIWNGAFQGCSNLQSLMLGNGLTNIGDSAFDQCALSLVLLGSSDTSIGTGAFTGCTAQTSFLCYGNEPSPDAGVFTDKTMPVYYLAKNAAGWRPYFGGFPTDSNGNPTAQWPGAVQILTPTHGTAAGGTSVKINAGILYGATGVNFGNASASFTIDSPTQITAITPAGTPGTTVNVYVLPPDGTAQVLVGTFTYDTPPPVISGIAPNHALSTGGASVVITGSYFNGATSVKFGLVDAASFNVDSATQITATVPAGTPGQTLDIRITNAGGTSESSIADNFTYDYPVPAITTLSPTHAPSAATVVIAGSGFYDVSAVNFGLLAASSFTVDSPTQITAVVPAGTAGQLVDISVTTPGGTNANTAADNFTFDIPVPAIAGVSPNHGPGAGGTSVTITGVNFSGATAVNFGLASASFVVNSSTQITATSPAGSPNQLVDISVTTPNGTSAAVVDDQFSYDPVAPTVTSLSPSHGPSAGGNSVVIVGTNFTKITSVKFGTRTVPLNSISIDSDTQITAPAPAGSAGQQVNVIITNQGGTSASTVANLYNYNANDSTPPKVVLSFPKTGAVASSFDVRGFATDNQGIDRVEVTLNGGPVQQAQLGVPVSGTTSFSLLGMTPDNGKNVLVVRAYDYQNNPSTPITIYLNYVVSRPELAGVYTGLLVTGSDVSSSNATSGLAKITVNASGLFTGKVTLGGASMSVSGVFGTSGTARFNPALTGSMALIGGGTNYGTLALNIATDASGKVTGALTNLNGGIVSSIDMDRAYYDGRVNLVDPGFLKNNGLYTAVFANLASSTSAATSTFPQGNGFASVKVGTNGIVTLKGTLPDGSAFTASAPLSKDYHWPCFAQLYSKQGSLAGMASFQSASGISEIKGLGFLWIRPGMLSAKYYPAGWSNGLTLDLLGAEYSVPQSSAATSVFPNLGPTSITGNSVLEFSDGKLAGEEDFNLNIDSLNKVAKIPSNSSAFSLTLSASTGSLTGSFTHTDGTKPAYKGIILQHDVNAGAYTLPADGYGFFLSIPVLGGTGESGGMTLFPSIP